MWLNLYYDNSELIKKIEGEPNLKEDRFKTKKRKSSTKNEIGTRVEWPDVDLYADEWIKIQLR